MRIRPMRPEDADAAEALTALAYGVRRDDEWRRHWRDRARHLQATDPGGCWVADDVAGEATADAAGTGAPGGAGQAAADAAGPGTSGGAGEATTDAAGPGTSGGAGEATADAAGPGAPGGAGQVVGVAISLRRDLLWVLSAYAVHPRHQGRGLGTALLDAAVGYGAGCLRGMLTARPDPQALRRYRRAGFTLHPTMRLSGTVDRSRLPAVDGVRAGTAADADLVDSVDRRVRGATHRPDQPFVRQHSTLLVCDLLTGSGYAYVAAWGVTQLAATNRAVAQRLLWAGLALTTPGATTDVRNLTSDQEWALDVGLAAGLRVEQDAYLALRHMRPPAPYVPSTAFG